MKEHSLLNKNWKPYWRTWKYFSKNFVSYNTAVTTLYLTTLQQQTLCWRAATVSVCSTFSLKVYFTIIYLNYSFAWHYCCSVLAWRSDEGVRDGSRM